MTDSKIQEVITRLKPHTLKNIMSLDPLERGLSKLLYQTNDSILIQSEDRFSIHSNHPEDIPFIIRELKKSLPKDQFSFLFAHESWYTKEIAQITGFSYIKPLLNSVFPKDAPLQFPSISGIELHPLTPEHHCFVRRHYKVINSDRYIKQRIEVGMIGAWLHGELVGFIGEHDEGSMGLLEVLPKARRLGIGQALIIAMAMRMRKQKRYAFANVEPQNEASIHLQTSVGMEICNEPVYWMFKPPKKRK